MVLKPIEINTNDFPSLFHSRLKDARIYDSSCSPEARVIFIDSGDGFFLKQGKKGSLEREALMTRYFHSKGISTEVMDYISENEDWLLTRKIPGKDGISKEYLDQPERLCDVFAQELRKLHEMDIEGCPIPNHTERYIASAKVGYLKGKFNQEGLPSIWSFREGKEAFDVIEKESHLLETNTLLHGDYCLPNIILSDWKLSGFIDLDWGGVGDRHVDLYWGSWTLNYNLKTDRYRERFMDAYGRDKIELDKLRIVAAAEALTD